jgi:hypothetical protein
MRTGGFKSMWRVKGCFLSIEGKFNLETKGIKTKKTQPKLSLFVVWGGIEPPTQGFSVLCSTN